MVSLSVQARTSDTKPKALRRTGVVPCMLYGNDTKNIALQCDERSLLKAYKQAGESTLVELAFGDRKIPVLFHAVDFHPVTEAFVHVDFFAVNMKKEIEARVPVHFEGEAPAVKELGGVLVTTLDHVTVRCLPINLPKELVANVSSLAAFGDHIAVASLQVPANVTVMEAPSQSIATVQEPRRIEEEEPAKPAEGEAALGAEAVTGAETGEKAQGDEGGEQRAKERGSKQG